MKHKKLFPYITKGTYIASTLTIMTGELIPPLLYWKSPIFPNHWKTKKVYWSSKCLSFDIYNIDFTTGKTEITKLDLIQYKNMSNFHIFIHQGRDNVILELWGDWLLYPFHLQPFFVNLISDGLFSFCSLISLHISWNKCFAVQ